MIGCPELAGGAALAVLEGFHPHPLRFFSLLPLSLSPLFPPELGFHGGSVFHTRYLEVVVAEKPGCQEDNRSSSSSSSQQLQYP